MPWKETGALEQRMAFVVDRQRGELSMAELCRTYGISRKTGYKWLARYDPGDLRSLDDQSRAPHHAAHAVPDSVQQLILACRGAHPTWGPRKLRRLLEKEHPGLSLPATSTIGALLRRHGLTVPRRRRRRCPPYSRPFAACDGPNSVWCADYKGWFRTGDGSRCEPLTIGDAYSRYALRCQALPRIETASARRLFEATFREFGMPEAIRTDNGPPFASRGLGGLSRLAVWWIRLGVTVERIAPGQPQQNGRQERFHLTLKQETTRPPQRTLRGQQRAFDAFCVEYNTIRPHEALDLEPPASVYQASSRPFPRRLPDYAYGSETVCRKVAKRGQITWRNQEIFISETLCGDVVGLVPVEDGLWRVDFCDVPLGHYDERTGRVRPLPSRGRPNRRKPDRG